MLGLVTVGAPEEVIPDASLYGKDLEADPLDEYGGLSDTARKFIRELEQRRLDGATLLELRHWSTGLGVPLQRFHALYNLISQTWDQGTVFGIEAILDRRNEIRVKHLHVYRKSMELANEAADAEDFRAVGPLLRAANAALDSLTKLDGLNVPDQVNVTVGAASNTNGMRDQLTALLSKVRTIAEKRGGLLPDASPHGAGAFDPDLTPGQETVPSNGSNGNGSNGKNGHTKVATLPNGVELLEPKNSKNTIVCIDCSTQRRRSPLGPCVCQSIRWRAWKETDD